jgi:hypothetical protein
MTTEALTWKPVASPPDSDTTVLLFAPAASEPVWLGYLDGHTWRDAEGYMAMPTHWAALPEGPKT